jgi:hypothetical protein
MAPWSWGDWLRRCSDRASSADPGCHGPAVTFLPPRTDGAEVLRRAVPGTAPIIGGVRGDEPSPSTDGARSSPRRCPVSRGASRGSSAEPALVPRSPCWLYAPSSVVGSPPHHGYRVIPAMVDGDPRLRNASTQPPLSPGAPLSPWRPGGFSRRVKWPKKNGRADVTARRPPVSPLPRPPQSQDSSVRGLDDLLVREEPGPLPAKLRQYAAIELSQLP